jgi:hypothetical protein
MAAAVDGIGHWNNRVRCFAENDMHSHGQRSEDVLLRTAEERKADVQARQEGSRQVLLHRHVNADYEEQLQHSFAL